MRRRVIRLSWRRPDPAQLLLLTAAIVVSLAMLEGVARTSWFSSRLANTSIDRLGYTQFVQGEYNFEGVGMYHEVYGYTLKPNLRNSPHGERSEVSSNSRGARGSREYSLERAEDTTRVLAIGDSFTFGEDVADHESYPAQLEAALDGGEVINLGMFGYGTDRIYLRLEEEGPEYRPDVVVLGYWHGDISRAKHWFFLAPKPQLVSEGGELKLSGVPVPTPEAFRRQPRVVHYLRCWMDGRARTERSPDLGRALHAEIAAEARAMGAVAVFVYLPSGEELRRPDTGSDHRRMFFDLCASSYAVCLDPTPRFLEFLADEPSNESHFSHSGHYSADLNAVVAQEILEYLED